MGKSVRYWISLVAIVSVLLHAGFVARHNQSVLIAALADSLTLDLSILCGNVLPDDLAENGIPGPKQNTVKCPICIGSAPAVAVADAVAPVLDVPPSFGPKLAITADAPAPSTTPVLPPNRGPPLAA